MDSLLSVSFDNLASRDCNRIRKGLRQIEGVLAQICLSPSQLSPKKRRNSALAERNGSPAEGKRLGALRKDAVFREFFRLQESFQWNVASRLLATLERLLGMGNASQTDLVILATLEALQGALLLHPPSRALFAREDYMNLALDLLDATQNPPAVQAQALLVLVTALLAAPPNARVFERVDGLLTVTSLFKSRATPRDVKMRTLEFLYFYLMPEAPPAGAASAPNTARRPPRPPPRGPGEGGGGGGFAAHARTHSGDGGAGPMDVDGGEPELGTKSTEEKQRLLGRYLTNVAELVQDLRESTAFAAVPGPVGGLTDV